MEDIYKSSRAHLRHKKKRSQYNWLSACQKLDLIFRIICLNENLREVCEDLKINVLTGRNIVQNYRKYGSCSLQCKSINIQEQEFKIEGKRVSSENGLGIVLIDDVHMKLVPSKAYNEEEEIDLICLHKYFESRHLV